MVTMPGGIDEYFAAIAALQTQVFASQREQLLAVAQAMIDTVQQDKRIFTFGTGHSHMLAEESHFRAGGLANAVPMLYPALMLHDSARLSGELERTPGVARALFNRYQPQAGEMLFIYSNSGVNAVPVEMALVAKEHGLLTVAVCSLAYARIAPLSNLGQRLPDIVDFVIDNGTPPGDGLIALDGSAWRVGPGSTVLGALIWNALIAEVAVQLQDRSGAAPVYVSSNLPGATEHNAALLNKWQARNPHL